MAQPVIINSGGANLASLRFALQRLDMDVPVTRDAAAIRAASHVLLPGVGAARDAMDRLAAAGLDEVIRSLTQPVLTGIGAGSYAYFVHSYAVPVGDFTLATTDYGGPLSAVVGQDNFFGTQFHPERSARVGARILRNFLELPWN
jgi:glutamine amidotransferase